jgi:hypothetical protein
MWFCLHKGWRMEGFSTAFTQANWGRTEISRKTPYLCGRFFWNVRIDAGEILRMRQFRVANAGVFDGCEMVKRLGAGATGRRVAMALSTPLPGMH